MSCVVFECPCGGSTECLLCMAFFKCEEISPPWTVHSDDLVQCLVSALCPAGLYTGSRNTASGDLYLRCERSHGLFLYAQFIQQTRELVPSALNDPRYSPLSVKLILNTNSLQVCILTCICAQGTYLDLTQFWDVLSLFYAGLCILHL